MRFARIGLRRFSCKPRLLLGIVLMLLPAWALSSSSVKDSQATTPPSKQASAPEAQNDSRSAGNEGKVAAVKSINRVPGSTSTRISIVSDGPVRYTKGVLDNPDRVYFDIRNAHLDSVLLNKTIAYEDPFVKQARAAQNRPDVVRIVFDLKGSGEVAAKDIADAFGIAIDFANRGAISFRGQIPQEVSTTSSKVPDTRAATPPSVSAESKPPNPVPAKAKQEPLPQPPAVTLTPSAKTVSDARPPNPPPAKSKQEPGVQPPDSPAAAVRIPAEAKLPLKSAAAEKERKEDGPSLRVAPKDPVAPSATGPGKEVAKPPQPVPVAKGEPAAKTEPPTPLPSAALPTSHGNRTLTRVLGLKIGRIVLDPGHGGQDKGTVGPGGLMEKDLVLAIAKDLQKQLEEKLGAQVVLTRNDDSFVSLEDRTLIANRHQADLFVSIHANSSVYRSVSGVETYFLDFARTDSAREVAARENATSDRNIRDLQELVQKITQADKLQESRELATIMQKYLYGAVHKLIPPTADRGVRSAPFIVLIGAHMPSVLTEISFISNPRDETLLLKDPARQVVTAALFQGIEGYMKSLGSSAARQP
jgi:N-acetylmuramoyl-L-alanine amidase